MLSERRTPPLLLLLILLVIGLVSWGIAAGEAKEPEKAGVAAGYEFQNWQSQIVEMPGVYDHMSDRSLRFDSADHAHMVFGGDRLYYAHSDGVEWQVEMVDTDIGTGTGASLALDAGGRPHISYYDMVDGKLKYAHWDGAAWQIEVLDNAYRYEERTSIAIDGQGRPHIAYKKFEWLPPDYNCPGMGYAHWDGGQWVLERFSDCGNFPSLALSSTGNPHITFNNGGAIKHATKAAGLWQIGTASDSQVGYGSSVAVDSAGRPHVAYVDTSTDGQLVYAHWDGSQWLRQTVQHAEEGLYLSLILDEGDGAHIAYGNQYVTPAGNGLDEPDSASAVSGTFSSIALDSNGYPAISYYSPYGFSVSCDRWTGSEWITESIADGGFAGQANSLALDGSGGPHVSYYNSIGGNAAQVRYGYRSGGIWSTETITMTYVPSFPSSHYDTSLAVDSGDSPHVAFWYSDYYDDGLYYGFKNGGHWQIELIADNADGLNDLVLDGSDGPHVAFADGGTLKYGYREAGQWHIVDVDDQAEGYLAVLALDSADRPRILYVGMADSNKTLKLAVWMGDTWAFEEVKTVDFGVSVVGDLTLDAAGKPHVVYDLAYDSSSEIFYGTKDGPSWTETLVDGRQWSFGWPAIFLDGDGQPLLAYYYQGLQVATRPAGQWDVQEAFPFRGDYLSAAFDGNHLFASYYDYWGGGLMVASPFSGEPAAYLPVVLAP